VEQEDNTGVVGPRCVARGASGGRVGVLGVALEALPGEGAVHLNDERVYAVLGVGVDGDVDRGGRRGRRIGPDGQRIHLVHGIQVAGVVARRGAVGALVQGRAAEDRAWRAGPEVAAPPARVDDEKLVALVDADVVAWVGRLGVVDAARVVAGVDFVRVFVEIANDAGARAAPGGVVRDLLLGTPAHLLHRALRGVKVRLGRLGQGVGRAVDVRHPELLVNGRGVVPEKVVRSRHVDVVAGRRLDWNDLDCVGEGPDHVVTCHAVVLDVDPEVPVGDLDVVVVVPVGIAEAPLENLLLGVGKRRVGAGEVAERPGAHVVSRPRVVKVVRIGQDLDRESLAAVNEVVDRFADDLGVHARRQSPGRDLDRGPRPVEVQVELELAERSRVPRESERVLDAPVGVDNILRTVDGRHGAQGELQQGLGHGVAVRRRVDDARAGDGDWLGDPVLPERVEELDRIPSREGVRVARLDAHRRVRHTGSRVVGVEGVDPLEARPVEAVRSGVAGIALAAHRDVLVPEAVDVLVVEVREGFDRHARAVAVALPVLRVFGGPAREGRPRVEDLECDVALVVPRRAGGGGQDVARARRALTGGPVVAREALALPLQAVAQSLVRALHVIVGGVVEDGAGRVGHQGKALGRPVRVDRGACNDDIVVVSHLQIEVHVALGRVDVRTAERTGPQGAVGPLIAPRARAHVMRAAWGVGG
ncbi:hypothetical protein THAOC_10729, partial [Thalassiosira oceanica]